MTDYKRIIKNIFRDSGDQEGVYFYNKDELTDEELSVVTSCIDEIKSEQMDKPHTGSAMIFLTEDMFKSGKPASQGEVLFWMKKYAPKEILDATANLKLTNVSYEEDKLIVGHSETSHHHVIEPVDNTIEKSEVITALIDAANDSYMLINSMVEFKCEHLRDFDTHKALVFPAGEYIRGLREEQTIEGWRRVAD